MKQKKLHISQSDFMLANRRASREEEIGSHGKQIFGRRLLHRSKKIYSRKRLKPVSTEE